MCSCARPPPWRHVARAPHPSPTCPHARPQILGGEPRYAGDALAMAAGFVCEQLLALYKVRPGGGGACVTVLLRPEVAGCEPPHRQQAVCCRPRMRARGRRLLPRGRQPAPAEPLRVHACPAAREAGWAPLPAPPPPQSPCSRLRALQAGRLGSPACLSPFIQHLRQLAAGSAVEMLLRPYKRKKGEEIDVINVSGASGDGRVGPLGQLAGSRSPRPHGAAGWWDARPRQLTDSPAPDGRPPAGQAVCWAAVPPPGDGHQRATAPAGQHAGHGGAQGGLPPGRPGATAAPHPTPPPGPPSPRCAYCLRLCMAAGRPTPPHGCLTADMPPPPRAVSRRAGGDG